MIPMILEECERHNYLTSSQVIDFIGISESTPGPFAINMATFIGYNQAGILGATFATFGVVLPSFIIILLIVNIIEKFKNNRYFKTVIKTIMPVVLGLILSTIINVTLSGLFNVENFSKMREEFSLNMTTILCLFIITLIVCLLQFFRKKKPAPVAIIAISAGLGIVISYFLL